MIMAEYYESTFSFEQPSKQGIHKKVISWVPPTWLQNVVIGILTPVLLWLVLFLLVGAEGLPGGQIFALFVLMIAGIAAGCVLELINLPPLLGMLAVGVIIGNVPQINFGKNVTNDVSYSLRLMGLTISLIRAGLAINPVALMKTKGVILRLAFGPCVVEAAVIAFVSHSILSLPWPWAFMLGFCIAAVAPAIVITGMLNLRDRNYGVRKGIPTLVIASAGVIDIIAMTAFNSAFAFAFPSNDNWLLTFLQAPGQLVFGLVFGLLWGYVLGLALVNSGQGKEAIALRLLFISASGCLSSFGFHYLLFGFGGLGCMTSTFIAAVIWRRKGVLVNNGELSWAFEKLWIIFQPLLFGLIGCEVDVFKLDSRVILRGVFCLFIGLIFRLLASFLVVAGGGLTIKERIFIAIAWIPKATGQASTAPVAYDMARTLPHGPVRDLAERRGLEILTIAVLCILMTAPLGSIAIKFGGPRLLTKDAISMGGDMWTLASCNFTSRDSSTIYSLQEEEEVENAEVEEPVKSTKVEKTSTSPDTEEMINVTPVASEAGDSAKVVL